MSYATSAWTSRNSRREPCTRLFPAAKNELLSATAYADRARRSSIFERKIADVYQEYQRRLVAANAMDFDDLLVLTVQLFREHPDVLDAYRERFLHILVDEYQDTNRAQNELVLQLAGGHHQVTVVGDSDQSIYGWRGADVRNILEFERAFPDATVVVLDQNYRSTQRILDAANAVISNNLARKPKDLWTSRDGGEQLVRYIAEDEHDEGAWLASEVMRLRRDEGYRWGDVAVFYRTNAQSRAIEEELVRQGVPYKVVGGARFYERREIKGHARLPARHRQPGRRGVPETGPQRAPERESATPAWAASTPGRQPRGCRSLTP